MGEKHYTFDSIVSYLEERGYAKDLYNTGVYSIKFNVDVNADTNKHTLCKKFNFDVKDTRNSINNLNKEYAKELIEWWYKNPNKPFDVISSWISVNIFGATDIDEKYIDVTFSPKVKVDDIKYGYELPLNFCVSIPDNMISISNFLIIGNILDEFAEQTDLGVAVREANLRYSKQLKELV